MCVCVAPKWVFVCAFAAIFQDRETDSLKIMWRPSSINQHCCRQSVASGASTERNKQFCATFYVALLRMHLNHKLFLSSLNARFTAKWQKKTFFFSFRLSLIVIWKHFFYYFGLKFYRRFSYFSHHFLLAMSLALLFRKRLESCYESNIPQATPFYTDDYVLRNTMYRFDNEF